MNFGYTRYGREKKGKSICWPCLNYRFIGDLFFSLSKFRSYNENNKSIKPKITCEWGHPLKGKSREKTPLLCKKVPFFA